MFITAFTSVRFFFDCFVTRYVFTVRSCQHLAQPPSWGSHPLSAVRDCLFNIFAATLNISRPFIHPQPEDATCCGDRDPLIMDIMRLHYQYFPPPWRYHPLWVCILQPSSRDITSSRTRFLDHTHRRATVGRSPLDE
jgi:hypothetical protein